MCLRLKPSTTNINHFLISDSEGTSVFPLSKKHRHAHILPSILPPFFSLRHTWTHIQVRTMSMETYRMFLCWILELKENWWNKIQKKSNGKKWFREAGKGVNLETKNLRRNNSHLQIFEPKLFRRRIRRILCKFSGQLRLVRPVKDTDKLQQGKFQLDRRTQDYWYSTIKLITHYAI